MTSDLKLDAICQEYKGSEFGSVNEKVTIGKRENIVYKILDGFLKQGNKSFINVATNVVRRATKRGNLSAVGADLILRVDGDDTREHDSERKSGPLLSGIAYCLCSCSMILLNKVVLSSYGFSAGISLMFYQNFVSVVVVVALSIFGAVSTEKLTWKLVRVWIPVNIIFVGMLVTGMYSLKYINVAMVTILKNVTNILTAAGELYIFQKRQNQKVWTAMFLMIISAVSGGITDISFDAVGYAWQIMNCIFTASYSLTLRHVMDTAKQSTRSGSLNEVTMVLLNNALSLPFAIFLILILNEWEYVYKVDVIRIPMFWFVATASGLLGLAISFTSLWFLNQTGPTTYSLVGSLNKIPISLAGIVLFNVPVSLPNLFSILFGLEELALVESCKQAARKTISRLTNGSH
ncbi:GDP-mannose transporter GONST2-like isoform X2 [Macadamia integrifolia]|nr:GDP-mannose transporter GONST2-like isoform X2 [Macadamia integrifolia]XP_042480120.1 GDP-mannose transporter GONST2-like isoform X2 [Macadamia integrifolia]XP_042480121.1 GDP-mannose transporter GONST2-like isoform X2 [Macadamia integrifolia]XP_042480122.1 GDP-mannose transporter GONST2-like isoform X2 [Macadamia integrifolia]